MQHRRILTLVLAAALIVPAATSGVVAQSASATSMAAQTEATQQTSENYTRLYVDDQYRSLELKPGESDTLNVTVENGEDESVTLSPHLYVPQLGQQPVTESWVDIAGGNITLDAGEERTVTVTVDVPEDAEIGRYNGVIAFTDEMVTFPGQPPRPVHMAQFSLEVWEEPTVTIDSDTWLSSQVQSGETTTQEIVVSNSGEEAVPLNPTIKTERRTMSSRMGQETLDKSWFEIDAPSEIPAGESATVEVTIRPPESADRGRYDAELDLGVVDPARPDDSNYWQQIHVGFQVWQQPEEPFETTVDVANNTESMTLTLSTNSMPQDGQTTTPSFDVTYVAPNGTTVAPERVERSASGHIDLGRSDDQQNSDSAYSDSGEDREITYRIDEPASGEWTAQIMPENAIQFGYEITRNESN